MDSLVNLQALTLRSETVLSPSLLPLRLSHSLLFLLFFFFFDDHAHPKGEGRDFILHPVPVWMLLRNERPLSLSLSLFLFFSISLVPTPTFCF